MKLRLHINRQSIERENSTLIIGFDLTKSSVFPKKSPLNQGLFFDLRTTKGDR